VTYLGVATLNSIALTPIGSDSLGRPIFQVVLPQGFFLVVEAKRGPSNLDIGTTVFNWSASDPNVRPDLEVEVDRPLGNGSSTVCDAAAPLVGGVPAVSPAGFGLTQSIANSLNDLGCRFSYPFQGSATGGRTSSEACTGSAGSYFFVGAGSTLQFCAQIGSELAFPPGDTVVTARVRDVNDQPGLPRSIIIRAP